MAITRILWQPTKRAIPGDGEGQSRKGLRLAFASEDNSLKIMSIEEKYLF
jgi:hypothetical protein